MTTVTISERAVAVKALHETLENLDTQQLVLAGQIGEMILVQVGLSRKSAEVAQALGTLLGIPNEN